MAPFQDVVVRQQVRPRLTAGAIAKSAVGDGDEQESEPDD